MGKFEKSLERLEEIVDTLDSGNISLEKAISLFEEGVKLTRECDKELKTAERKIRVLVKSDDSEEKEKEKTIHNDSNDLTPPNGYEFRLFKEDI